MSYTVVYLEDVVKKDIPALDVPTRNSIKLAIEENLTTNPVEFGKPLQYSLKGCRRLRVSDWRVIYQLAGQTVTIVKIGHRREIYG